MTQYSGSKRKSASRLSSFSSHASEERLLKLLAAEHVEVQDHHANVEDSSPAMIRYGSWRERVAQWHYDVVDHFNAPREIVYTSMNILDRYVNFLQVQLVEKEYKAISIASIFIAMRLSRSSAGVDIQRLMQISQPGLSMKSVLSLVPKMVKTLKCHGPILTPSAFVKAYLGLFRDIFDENQMLGLMEHALYLVELSVCDQHFFGVPSSKIAFAAVVLSMKPNNIDRKTASFVLDSLQKKTGTENPFIDIKSICSYLQEIYGQSYDNACNEISRSQVAIVEDYDDEDTPVPPSKRVKAT